MKTESRDEVFSHQRDANGEWRRLQNEELRILYRSPNIVRVIKSRRLRWAGHIARIKSANSQIDTHCLHEADCDLLRPNTRFKLCVRNRTLDLMVSCQIR